MQHIIILPDLGQTTAEATIVEFLKKKGSHVKRGEPILVASTDKADVDVEAFEEGFLREWLVEKGALASALSPVAVLTTTPDEPYELPTSSSETNNPVLAEIASEELEKTDQALKIAAVPAARIAAKELGIDLKTVKGTGASGLITKADVQRTASERGASGPGNFAKDRLAAMAAATLASKREIPHFYVSRDVWLKHAAQWRKTSNESPSNPHVSWNDIFVRCAAQALNENDGLAPKGPEAAMGRQGGKDILVVSANEPGLTLVPVPDPSALPWKEFLKFMRESKKSYPAGFSPILAISNLGMHGVKQFAAIIPPGCRAVLAIGAVREEPVAANGEVKVEQICTLTLSADHRVVDGIAAARFLEGMQHSLDAL